MTERDLLKTFTMSQLPFAPCVPIIRTEGRGVQQKGYRLVVPRAGTYMEGASLLFFWGDADEGTCFLQIAPRNTVLCITGLD